jgi:hypothetical protein
MAAAVWGIEHFDVYLIGKQFRLVTDHRPLEHLGTVHTKTLNRLQQLMLEYDFTIEYRVGEDNAVADYLSRNSTTTDTASVQEHVSTLNILFPEAEMDQSKDELMADIIRYMKTGNTPEKAQTQNKDRIKRLAHDSFLDEENRLWYRLPGKTRERIAFWTPRHMRKELMVAAHVSIETGHRGVARTVARLQSNYYWPGMSNDATNFVKTCRTCQLSKTPKPTRQPLQRLEVCDRANQRLHIDLIGLLKTTSSGDKYVMVMTDGFTKFCEVAAIPHKSATVVARRLFERWIVRYSAPESIVLDQGKESCTPCVTCGGSRRRGRHPFIHKQTQERKVSTALSESSS